MDAPRCLVLMPVLDDWAAARRLVEGLDAALAGAPWRASVLLVDDGSLTAAAPAFAGLAPRALADVSVLTLRRNLGHQRAIALGLAHAEACGVHDAIVVMDSDGEDAPEDAVALLGALTPDAGPLVVFAERTRRSEGLVFRAGYLAYLVLHRLLTGHRIRFGNFSALDRAALSRLVVMGELWNHYAASVVVSRIPYATVPTVRAKRLAGMSRMGFVGLVLHGLRALSVFSETIGVRLLVAGTAAAASMTLLVAAVGIAALWGARLPSWAPLVACAAGGAVLQGLSLAGLFVFVTLSGRSTLGFVPRRDHEAFVATVRVLASREPRAGA